MLKAALLLCVTLALATPVVFAKTQQPKNSITPLENLQLEASDKVTKANIEKFLIRFTAHPHPMGSEEQHAFAKEAVSLFEKFKWQASIQEFRAKAPNTNAKRFGGTESTDLHEIIGKNVVAVLPGREPCGILLGGHFDTKFMRNAVFVGANDGGSSTALLFELARLLTAKKSKKESGRWLECTKVFVLFDGEESLLEDWSQGEVALGIKDHLYGSRHFASQLKKKDVTVYWNSVPLTLAVVVDMIGHKNQNLIVSAKSNKDFASRILAHKARHTTIKLSDLEVEDDHTPLLEAGVPTVHIIDFVNLKEWHTPQDTLAIVSAEKIADVGSMLLRFLNEKR